MTRLLLLACLIAAAGLASADTVTVGSPQAPSSDPWCGS
jgi:hypothetical protein